MTEITVTLPAGLWWTTNDLRGSHHKWDSKVRAVRELGKAAAILSRAELTPPVALHVFVGYPTAVRADPPNIAGTVSKHCVDGFVDAGLLPDDNSSVIVATTYSREAKKSARGTHTLRFVFTEQAIPWGVS